ncbi:MAG TPA: hypothetical protein VLA24_14625 [Pseudomonadales bacterium]|nr:hypothetical protein [Pseudomonadales bacterium]
MRKRSKYRPKGVIVDTMSWVKSGMKPIAETGDAITVLRLRNHGAMAALTKGQATRQDLDILISCMNITEAYWRMGFGYEYKEVVNAGLAALRSVGKRGLESGKFILKADEMAALNEAMELHDAQLEVSTVKEMEQALDIVVQEIKHKRAVPIKEAA